MGTVFSFFAKAAASSAISGYAAHKLLISSSMLSRPARIAVTGIASFAGLVYYVKVWIQDYYFDWSYNDNRDLTGRTAVVTGGTVGGLGYAAAELLYQQGAKVIITVRTKEKGEAALQKLKDQTSSPVDDSRALYVLCDFLSESSVRNCAAEIKTKTSGGIDFLVLNAGISGQQGSKASAKQKESAGTDGKVKNTDAAKVWMTNHVGPWIFAQELTPSLIQAAKRNPSEHPRVVWVASGAHKKAAIDWEDPFHLDRTSGVSSYAQSKLANIMHAREYQKRVRDLLRKETEENKANEKLDVKCFSTTPGLVWTSLIPKIPVLYPLFWLIMRSPTMGAQAIKMACLDNDLKGGEYLSNCYVKDSQGIDGCSNDEELWKRLWELTAKQVEEKEYEKVIEISNANKKTI
jgi:NAD(P)-dependent dehydrogenase (short-subunit alcohol dehydrogenase family)